MMQQAGSVIQADGLDLIAEESQRPPWCAPWCISPGHGRGMGCGGDVLEVPLTLDVGAVDEDDRRLAVAAVHYENEGGTWIELFRPDQRGYQLTVDQAQQLIENLQLVLGQIREGQR